MNIKPLHDRIIVRRLEQEETTASGLIIASEDRTVTTFHGEIVAAGAGYQMTSGLRELDVAVGDTVLFGADVKAIKDEDGNPLFIMKESNVLGIITK